MQLFAPNPATIHFTTIENATRFYAATMDLWLHYGDVLKLKYHTIQYENLVGNMEEETRRMLKFLGLPWEQDILRFYARQGNGSATTPSYQDINKPIYTRAMGRWHIYEAHMQPAIAILKPYLREFGYEL